MPRIAWKKLSKIAYCLWCSITLLKATAACRTVKPGVGFHDLCQSHPTWLSDDFFSCQLSLPCAYLCTLSSRWSQLSPKLDVSNISRQTAGWEITRVKWAADSACLASQCKYCEQPTSHRISWVHSPFLWSIFKVNAQKQLQKKGRYFVSKYQLWKEKKEVNQSLNWNIFEEHFLPWHIPLWHTLLCDKSLGLHHIHRSHSE